MAKNLTFKNTKDVNFKWIEQLYKDSYQSNKCKVVAVIRGKSKGKPWRDITTTDTAAKSVVKMTKEGYDEVRLVVNTGDDDHTYINVPTKELHKEYKFPKPRKS